MSYLNIKPGDEIDYTVKHRNNQHKKWGEVIQVTQKVITVQGQRYPDTILLADIDTGEVVITKINGQPFIKPEVDEDLVISQALELFKTGMSIKEIADHLGVQSGWLGLKLEKANKEQAQQNYLESRAENGSGVFGQLKKEGNEKGEDTVAKGVEMDKAQKQRLLNQAKELMRMGLNMNKAAETIGVPAGTLSGWFKQEEKKQQTQGSDPGQVASQDPDKESQESA